MPDIKNDSSNLGDNESKRIEPEHRESKDEEQKKVYEAMWLSWGG